MGPAELLDYDRDRVRGLVLARRHAKQPCGNRGARPADPDGGSGGRCSGFCRPGRCGDRRWRCGQRSHEAPVDVEKAYSEKVSFRAKRQAQYAKLRDVAAVTKDGAPVSLLINAGLLVDLPHLKEAGADGIGLFRTELQFMIASSFPRMTRKWTITGR